VDVSARSSGGGVHINLPFDGDIDDESIEGRINGGGPKLTLSTSAGSVSVLKRTAEAESTPKPKAKPKAEKQ
jgi:hypothetical protein